MKFNLGEPRDTQWSSQRAFLPCMVTAFILTAVSAAFSLLYSATVGAFAAMIVTLIITLLNLLIIGYWIFLYFRSSLDVFWTLIMFGVSAVWKAAGTLGRVRDLGGDRCPKRCALWRFVWVIDVLDVICLGWLTFMAWRVWRMQKKSVREGGSYAV